MKDNISPYWMALAHAKNFSNRRKMDFLIEVVHDKETIVTAFEKMKTGDKLGFDFSSKEWDGMQEAVSEIPNNAFLAENLLGQGIEIVHVMEKFTYPKILKDNLKKEAPIVIYTKGNADLLKKNSIAIVGSRQCSQISMDFADTIAWKAVEKKSVVVSGFAKGIDKQALDAALKFKGQSIIVLPQGIETYQSKIYYPAIIRGDVLVISTYHPNAPWSVGLAMDRNKVIYGLAEEIYVAESSDTGGTWEGVLNGIKRGRKVFVRMASPSEKNANNILIEKGAIAVDLAGNTTPLKKNLQAMFNETDSSYQATQNTINTDDEILEKIVIELQRRAGKGITVNEVVELLQLDKKANTHLNKIFTQHPKFSKVKKGSINLYYLKENIPQQISINLSDGAT